MPLPSCSTKLVLPCIRCCAAYDLPAKGLADSLMAQTDAQNRNFPGHVPDERNQDARLARRARPRREQNPLRLERFDLLHRQFVVAADLDLRAQFPQVLDKGCR